MFNQNGGNFSAAWTGALTTSWGKASWKTSNGLTLEFQVYPFAEAPSALSAIYLLVRKTYIGQARANRIVLIGESSNLRATLAEPGIKALPEQHGPLDVHVRRYTDTHQRSVHLQGLIANLGPRSDTLKHDGPSRLSWPA